MSELVEVESGDNAGDTAVLLLAAAEELGLDANVVQTQSGGVFLVPKEVADKVKSGNKAAKKATAKKTAKQ